MFSLRQLRALGACVLVSTAIVAAACGKSSSEKQASGGAAAGSGSAAGANAGGGAGAGKKFQLAMIPKGSTHEFWKSVHAGAVKASRELKASQGLDVQIIWKGPIREDDREQQIQVVEGFLSQGVSGILLAPLDNRALVRPVEEAKAAGIPTVVFDSALESPNIVSYVATDNYKGGRLAAQQMGTVLGGKGKVLMIRYQEGSASTEQREKGFLDGLKEGFPNIEVVSSDQYAGATRDTAKRASENVLNRFGNVVQGIFAPNESSAAGMLLALQDLGKAGKITFIGFDASPVFLEAMKRKEMQGFVLQNPFEMGYRAVNVMVDALQGKKVEPVVDTGVAMITPENMDQPEQQKLLNPPIAEYLQ